MSNLDKFIEWMEEEYRTHNDITDFIEGYRSALLEGIEKAKQLQKEEPKTYTPLEAANEYHKEKGVLPPNDKHSWYVIAVNDYLKRTQTYTQDWINVKDELPKEDGRYIVFCPEELPSIKIDFWHGEDGWEINNPITHWYALNPPKTV